MSRLAQIFDFKRREVEGARARVPLADLKDQAADAPASRGFRSALVAGWQKKGLALIAEVKKASPSMGTIRADFDPVAVAQAYERAGADCLSVLTDVEFFQGSPQNLVAARQAVSLPLLRKDFLFDEYQVYEARAWGADAILLIVAGLEQSAIRDLSALAKGMGMDVLVEVHSEAEAEVALALDCDLVGVNNRDLATFETDLGVSEAVLPLFGKAVVRVSESALGSRADLDRVQAAGAQAVLIGTTFCAAPSIEKKVREVMGW